MYEVYIPRKGLAQKPSPCGIAQYRTKQGWNVTNMYIASDLISQLIGKGNHVELRVDKINNKIALLKSESDSIVGMKISKFPKRCILQVGKLEEIFRICDITECKGEFQKNAIDGKPAIILTIPKEILKTSTTPLTKKKDVRLLPKPFNNSGKASENKDSRVH